ARQFAPDRRFPAARCGGHGKTRAHREMIAEPERCQVTVGETLAPGDAPLSALPPQVPTASTVACTWRERPAPRPTTSPARPIRAKKAAARFQSPEMSRAMPAKSGPQAAST